VKLVNGQPAQVLEACRRCREAATSEADKVLEECRHGGWWSS
jgi:hypothetical protein